jgi:hypothetical protein
MMETFIPSSSHLDRVDFDSDTQELTVTFKDGRAYLYRSVPVGVFQAIQNARSAGSYFDRNVKSRYSGEEV